MTASQISQIFIGMNTSETDRKILDPLRNVIRRSCLFLTRQQAFNVQMGSEVI